MENTLCSFGQTGSFTDRFQRKLIRADAKVRDNRTGEKYPMTFYYIRDLDDRAVNEDTIAALIRRTVSRYGFEFFRIEKIESEQIILNAEALWEETHGQKCLPF